MTLLFTNQALSNAFRDFTITGASCHSAFDQFGGFEVSTAHAPLNYINLGGIITTFFPGGGADVPVPADTVVSWVGFWSNQTLLGMAPVPEPSPRSGAFIVDSTDPTRCRMFPGSIPPLVGDLVFVTGSLVALGATYTVLSSSGLDVQLDDGTGNPASFNHGAGTMTKIGASVLVPFQGIVHVGLEMLII